jgi:hypothetical protein
VPLQNRVTPFGEIVVSPARGLLFGNRGILHDEHRHVFREWQSGRWIACRLEFKGRHRHPMPVSPQRYTGLFFLDEATSFAAGHRPCAECRREDFGRFRDLWGSPATRVHEIDGVLHDERLQPAGPGSRHRKTKRTHRTPMAGLPDGAMVAVDDSPMLVLGGELLTWTPFGYTERRTRPRSGDATLLTPPSTVAVIHAGYAPAVHPSATGSPTGLD